MTTPFQILNLRRRLDNTIYAYLCLRCGGAAKVYHTQKVCYCGAMSAPSCDKVHVEGEWRQVRWDGRQCDGTLSIYVERQTLLNSTRSRGWMVVRDGMSHRRSYPTKREAVRAARRRCARLQGKWRLCVERGREGYKEIASS